MSDIKSVDSIETDDEIEQTKKELVDDEIVETIVKYMKMDDIIREKQKDFSIEQKKFRAIIKPIKDERQKLEDKIINRLNDNGENMYEIAGKGKLIKKQSERKGVIKPEIIKESVMESMRRANLIDDEARAMRMIDGILEMVDHKRPVTNKVYIKRTIPRQYKPEKKEKNKDNHKNNLHEEVPKKKDKKNKK